MQKIRKLQLSLSNFPTSKREYRVVLNVTVTMIGITLKFKVKVFYGDSILEREEHLKGFQLHHFSLTVLAQPSSLQTIN